MKIANRTLQEWREYARRDDCLDRMAPIDLRLLISKLETMEEAMQEFVDRVEAGSIRSERTYNLYKGILNGDEAY